LYITGGAVCSRAMPEAPRLATNGADKIQELLKRRDDLMPRLRKGRERIRLEQERGGERADYYLEFWLTLLTDYEQTIDQLRALGADEAAIAGESGPDAADR
jgi:hypothetical protein